MFKTILPATAIAIALTSCVTPEGNGPSSLGPHSEHWYPPQFAYDTPRSLARDEIPLQASNGGSYYLPVTLD
jgi:hypothetical protein